MKISVAYAAGSDSFWQELEVEEGLTAGQAIEQSRLLSTFIDLNIADMKLGIFGKVCSKNQKLSQGDRVELYQKLSSTFLEPEGIDDDDDDDDF